jgi:hypothetical protein
MDQTKTIIIDDTQDCRAQIVSFEVLHNTFPYGIAKPTPPPLDDWSLAVLEAGVTQGLIQEATLPPPVRRQLAQSFEHSFTLAPQPPK